MDVIDACTNIKDIRKHLEFVTNEESSEEEADMCYALDQIQRNAEKKGKRREDLLQATADAGFRQKLLAEYEI